ncbi:MAG TPA: hypothetical protein VMS78_09110, partial [Rhizomicrobium sp.]|nr:hypothetical protein [Rhizomicrobium sp.]
MQLPDFILEGKDVLLRPLALGDVEALAAAAAESRDSFSWTWVPNGLDETRMMAEMALKQRREGVRYPLVTIYRGKIVGWTSYYRIEFWDWPEGHPQFG